MTAYPLARRHRPRSSFSPGFTLLEVLVALAIVVSLVALMAGGVSFGKTSGQKAYIAMQRIAAGLQRMRVDLPCYPANTASLFQSALASNPTCGNMAGQWRGPYYATTTVDGTGNNILLGDLGANAVVTLGQGANMNGDGNNTQYYVQLAGLPQDAYNEALIACNGATAAGAPNNAGVRPCIGAMAQSGNTIQLIFDESKN